MFRTPAYAALASSLLLAAGLARADVWLWVDANGDKHFVDSNQPIYTWRDDQGKVHYSDKPDHEDAIRVQLFWHSKGTLAEVKKSADVGNPAGAAYAHPGETAEERNDRESVVARNCKRANEILHSYENAPKLYRTDDDGRRHILTDEEYAAEVADARRKTDALCGQ